MISRDTEEENEFGRGNRRDVTRKTEYKNRENENTRIKNERTAKMKGNEVTVENSERR